MRFEWIEVESNQAAYLMAVIAEFVFIIKRESEEPTFKVPKWLRRREENRITWKLIKKELFSSKKKPEEGKEAEQENGEDDEDEEEEDSDDETDEEAEYVHRLDNLYDEASSDESGDEGLVAKAPRPRNKTRYRPS